MPLCVTGTPANAGAAIADVTPGTTSKSMPAATSARPSSPPRPKTKGSPPLSLTTRLPDAARSTSSALISSWVMVWPAGDLPA